VFTRKSGLPAIVTQFQVVSLHSDVERVRHDPSLKFTRFPVLSDGRCIDLSSELLRTVESYYFG
jgi:hypothetical protein